MIDPQLNRRLIAIEEKVDQKGHLFIIIALIVLLARSCN